MPVPHQGLRRLRVSRQGKPRNQMRHRSCSSLWLIECVSRDGRYALVHNGILSLARAFVTTRLGILMRRFGHSLAHFGQELTEK